MKGSGGREENGLPSYSGGEKSGVWGIKRELELIKKRGTVLIAYTKEKGEKRAQVT